VRSGFSGDYLFDEPRAAGRILRGMATIDYLHICDYAFPAEGGKPCFIGVFDRITAPAFPVAHPYMAVAFQIHGTAHELVPLKIELVRPNGEVLVTLDGQIVLNESGGGFVNFNLMQTQFPEAGRYIVKVSSAGKTLVSHPLHLVKAQGATQSAPPGSVPKQFH